MSGRGRVYSYTVNHQRNVAGFPWSSAVVVNMFADIFPDAVPGDVPAVVASRLANQQVVVNGFFDVGHLPGHPCLTGCFIQPLDQFPLDDCFDFLAVFVKGFSQERCFRDPPPVSAGFF